MRSVISLTALALCAVACNKAQTKTNSTVDSLPDVGVTAPKQAKCSQVITVENIQVRETLIVQILGNVVSGTYHYSTGEKNALTDTGFQHIVGRITKNDSSSGDKVTLKLSKGQLSTYFDEDFASNKELNEVVYDLKEKKVSFLLAQDERPTSVGSCQFD